MNHILCITVLMVLSGCSAARGGLGLGQTDSGMYAEDGATTPDGGQACPPEGCGEVNSGTLDVDAGTDSGMIVMHDAGSADAGSADAGSADAGSADACSSVTGHCYHYIDTPGGESGTCASLGMELAWWTTAVEQHEIQALSFVSPGVRTDLACTGPCSSGSYRWVDHPGSSVLGVEWDGMSPLVGVSPILIPLGMYALDGSSGSRGYLCQSL